MPMFCYDSCFPFFVCVRISRFSLPDGRVFAQIYSAGRAGYGKPQGPTTIRVMGADRAIYASGQYCLGGQPGVGLTYVGVTVLQSAPCAGRTTRAAPRGVAPIFFNG